MRRVLVRSILTGTLAASLLSGTALGHECFVASRSDTGNVAAGSNSARWLTVAELSELFLFVGDMLGKDPLSPSQLAWAVEAGRNAGLPDHITIFIGAKTIAEGTPAMAKHDANGKGIDHVFGWIPVAAEIYDEALGH